MADKVTSIKGSKIDGTIGQKIDQMQQLAATRRKRFEINWYNNNFFDDGHHFRYVSRTTGRIIDLARVKDVNIPQRAIPKASRQIRGVANLLSSLELQPVIYPETVTKSNYPDPREFAAAKKIAMDIASKEGHWLQEEWKEQELKEKMIEMIILAAKHGVSFLQIWPDPVSEKIETKVWDAFDIYLMGELNEIYDSPFIIKCVPQTIAEIKANENFDEAQKEQLNPDNRYASSELKEAYLRNRHGGSEGDIDERATVLLKEAFIKTYLNKDNIGEIREKYPDVVKDKKEGDMCMRHAFSAGGVWLLDEYVDLPEYPFVDFRLEPGPIYQTPLMDRFIPANKSLDVIMSRIERWANTMGVGIWLKRKGEDFEITNVPGGQEIEYKATPPQQAQVPPLPSTMFNLVSLLEKFIEEQGASTAALGKLPEGVRSGVAIESIKSTEFDNLKIAADMLRKTVRRTSERIIELASDYYVSPRTIKLLEKGEPSYFDIIGSHGARLRDEIKEELPPETIVIDKDITVDVQIQSGLGFTIEGKRETMQQIVSFVTDFAQAGYINPEAVKVTLKQLLETYQFGATQQFMEALDSEGGVNFTEQQIDAIKVAVLETMIDAGIVGPEKEQQQVDATKVGLLETMEELSGQPQQ